MKSKHKAFLLILDGPMGTGKTTVSKLLHEKLEGVALVTLSNVKKFIFDHEKDHAYNKISQEVILVMVNKYLELGISVIVEWAMRKERVKAFKEIAKENGAQFYIYQLEGSKDLLLKRVKERTRILLNKKLLPKKNIANVEKHFEQHHLFHSENKYNNAIILNSEKLSATQIARKILRDIKN